MSDYVSCCFSTFEHLANDLLLIIFEYLDLHSVYDGFFGLNRRFNSLLASNLLPPNILTLHLYPPNDNSYQTFIDFVASRIIKLHIDNYLSDHSYDFVNFPNVRLLILQNPCDKQCEQVNRHTLPHLKYLYVQNGSFSKRGKNFYFNPYNISHLYSIRIDGSYFRIRWPERDSFLHYLHSLTITVEESYDIYLKILVGCPNLFRLEIKLWSRYGFRMQRNLIPQLNLRRLIIDGFGDLSNEMLEFLLSNAPNLTHFTVISGLIDIEYDTLATILTRYTVHLEVLDVALRPPGYDNEHIRTCIQQAHPLFYYIEWFYAPCSIARTYIRISSKKKCRWRIC